MSKRTINIDEIMSRAQKKRKSNYDILDEGSKIVKSDKLETDSKIKDRAGASALNNRDQVIPKSPPPLSKPKEKLELTTGQSNKTVAPKLAVSLTAKKTTEPNISENAAKTIDIKLPEGLSKIETFMISAARDNLNSREYKILICLIAETYFGEKQDVEFSLDRMGELSGVYKNHVSGVIKSLVERGAVIKTKSESGQSNRYGLNMSSYHPKWPNKQS